MEHAGKKNSKAKKPLLWIVLIIMAVIQIFPLVWLVDFSLASSNEMFTNGLLIISNLVTKPLRQLCTALDQFSAGDFEQQVEVTTHDEVGEVAECFNRMVLAIKELIDKNYVITLQEKESELAALQALRYGAKEYLLKPVRATDILKCVEKLADEYYEEKSEENEQTEGTQMNSFVKSAREYVEEHYTDDISLQEVAEKIGISAGYLSTMFAQNMNCKFVDYLNKVRIDRACTYLEQNYLKTYEIAYRVGFRDEKYFSRVFKKVKGMSPKEYRTGSSQEQA